MTPEAKAREILAFYCEGHRIELVVHIAQALRDVERETLERAAQVAEDFSAYDDALQRDSGCKTSGEHIAQSIRSLLQKEGG